MLGATLEAQIELPEGFTHEQVIEAGPGANGLTFDLRGRMYLWYKNGRVSLYQGDSLIDANWLDLREEVADWRDHGLLGFGLHPDFQANGYFYLLYTVDRHHLMHHGQPSYHPDSNAYFQASIGRLTRYQADPATDFTSVLPDSRKVLLGTTPPTGLPVLHESHAVGTLAFGQDGSLLLSMGDGASFYGRDVGGDQAGAYASQALADGIIRPAENVGVYRAQLPDSYSGKVLRLDPLSGEGLPDNPFFDPAAPRAPRSQVWTLGLRNPFRLTVIPDSTLAGPGRLLIGDVGLRHYEEINLADRPGLNFGWPIFEGVDSCRNGYHRFAVDNLDAPLEAQPGCAQTHFRFTDLLQQERGEGPLPFSHPCRPWQLIPATIPTFVHRPPLLAWAHQDNLVDGAQVPFYPDSGLVASLGIRDLRSGVLGDPFWGGSVTGGVYYQGEAFPPAYRGNYLFADYVTGWIKALRFDSLWRLTEVLPFAQTSHYPTDLKVNPTDGCLYYVNYGFGVSRVCLGGNVAPQARISLDRSYGPSPLTVQFSAAPSTDFNGDSLWVQWDFGDGDSSQALRPTYTFTNDSDQPLLRWVTLRVRDSAGAEGMARAIISLDNTPPQAEIVGLPDDFTYPALRNLTVPLRAEASDAEQPAADLSYQWQVILHHNTHEHPEEVQFSPEIDLRLSPTGCDEGETHWYRVTLEVTDAAGLSATDDLILYPDCEPAILWGNVTAAWIGDGVQLRWETELEQGVQDFVVERSLDGVSFEAVAKLEPAGQDGGGHAYQWLDRQPLSGDLTYRVRMREDAWKQEVSPNVTLSAVRSQQMALYPNPATDQLTVDLGRIEGEAQLRLYDALGRQVRQWRWSRPKIGPQTLELSEVQPGAYLLRAEVDGRRLRQWLMVGR
jgi:glucose/arabinose dehydrogenase